MPRFQDFPFKHQYSGVCELCQHICGDKSAVEALREKLNEPQLVALRVAQQCVKTAARDEVWHREAVNSKEARRVLFLLLCSKAEHHSSTIQQVLGRADLDWHHLSRTLEENGLMDRLHELREPLGPHAPQFFWATGDEQETRSNPFPSLDVALESWKKSDFKNLLALAVAINDSPQLEGELCHSRSAIAKLAHRLLLSNGLYGGTQLPRQPNRLDRLRIELVQAVLDHPTNEHENFFVKPTLHVTCASGIGDYHRALVCLLRALRRCAAIRGWGRTLRLLVKDLAKSKHAFPILKTTPVQPLEREAPCPGVISPNEDELRATQN